MTGRSKDPRPTRLERKRLNRLARVNAAAADEDQGVAHLGAAYDFWRAMCKKLPPEGREGHRRRLAELLTNDALNELDTSSITRLEAVA